LTFDSSLLALRCLGLRLNCLGVALCSRNLTLQRLQLSLQDLCPLFSLIDLALRGQLLLGYLLAQTSQLGLSLGARLAFALYNLHCSQHFLLERLKFIHCYPRSHC